MKTLYDVQQMLERFGVLVHIGKRKWDIEEMAIELDRLHEAHVISEREFLSAKLVLRHEHEYEVAHENDPQRY
ncbi:MAG: YqgQ family protein [Lactobacillus sp.]